MFKSILINIHLASNITCCFSSECKLAKAKPLFAKGIQTEAKNYRPITLLPLISKVIEKLIHNQTHNYLQKKMNCCTFTNQVIKQIISKTPMFATIFD